MPPRRFRRPAKRQMIHDTQRSFRECSSAVRLYLAVTSCCGCVETWVRFFMHVVLGILGLPFCDWVDFARASNIRRGGTKKTGAPNAMARARRCDHAANWAPRAVTRN